MELVPGAQLGQYRLVEQVGRGGMATVYKAFQPALNRYVAVKVLPAFYAEDERFLERFRQEAQTVSQLRHPNILAVFDFGEQDGVTYMVSEYLPGGTLERHLGRPLSISRAVELLGPIAGALDYAHARGMIHRDVKPSNILLTEDDTPVLSDFGVARIVAGSSRLTATGAAVGTPEYMAPEQAAGDPTTPASDRYALGIVLYEMLTGRIPYEAETPIAVALAHMHKPLPLPRSINPDLPEAAEAVLLKALAKAPDERFESSRAMIDGLERSGRAATDSRPTLASVPAAAAVPPPRPDGPASRSAEAIAPADEPRRLLADPPRFRRSNVPIVAGLLGLLLVIGLASFFFIWPPGGNRPAGEKPAPTQGAAPKPNPAAAGAPGAAGPTSVAPAPAVAAAPAASPAAKPGLPRPARLPLERVLPQLAARLGAAIEHDDFSNPASGLFAIPPNLANDRIAYENGSLVIEHSRKGPNELQMRGILASRPTSFTNGVVDVETRLLAGPDTSGAFLQFRRTANDGNGYYLLALPQRRVLILQKQVGQERTEIARGPAEALLPEGVNRLIVVADGPNLQVYVNGQSVLTGRDETYTSGLVGLGASTGPVEGDVRVAFDDFRTVSLN